MAAHRPQPTDAGPARDYAAALARELAAWLERENGLGAAVWLGREAGRWRALAAVGEGSVAGEAPEGLAWDLLAELEPGAWRRLGAAELRARPALLARGVREAVLASGGAGERALWLEAPAPARLERALTEDLREHLGTLEGRLARGEAEARSRELEERARLALGTHHDLRNELFLALLELERCELGTVPGSAGLRRALEGALELARRPLARPDPRTPVDLLSPGPRGGASLRGLLEEEARAAARLAGADCAVAVLLHCPRDLCAPAPESALRRWVRNAVLNALRASPAGGRVRVVGEPRPGGGGRLWVEDEGRGMSPGDAARLFRPGASAEGGSGHGTSVLADCARALGAVLELETELGRGSALRLEWPAGPGPSESEGSSRTRPDGLPDGRAKGP